MPWQRVVGVNRETGGLILENSEGEQYEAHLIPQVEELLEADVELHVKVEQYPEWQPNRFQAWWLPDRQEK